MRLRLSPGLAGYRLSLARLRRTALSRHPGPSRSSHPGSSRSTYGLIQLENGTISCSVRNQTS